MADPNYARVATFQVVDTEPQTVEIQPAWTIKRITVSGTVTWTNRASETYT